MTLTITDVGSDLLSVTILLPDEVQSALPEVYERITDSAAFSMYILSDRAAPDDPCAIGRVFARLCGHGKEALFERYGCELAEYFTMYCTQLLLRIHLIR